MLTPLRGLNMNRKRLALVGSLALIAGCANASTKLNRLSVGMDKQQVVKVMGQPYYTGAKDGTTIMQYKLEDEKFKELYYVRLLDGRVESYGKLGDFDSTKDPTSTNNINLTVRKLTDASK
jgi:hypothetical protein